MAQQRQPPDRRLMAALLDDPARAGAARAAVRLVEPGMFLGLGSGRAVWATTSLLGQRDDLAGLRVVAASSETEALAASLGFRVAMLDGAAVPDLYIDGADEVDPDLSLLKGHGAALLREKLLAVAARRFVVVAEAAKRVGRLGDTRALPVEVVRFACADTRRRLRDTFAEVTVRTDQDRPMVTDEGHHLLEVAVPDEIDILDLAEVVRDTVGVIEHGLFIDMADEVLLGGPDGTVEVLQRRERGREPQAGLRP